MARLYHAPALGRNEKQILVRVASKSRSITSHGGFDAALGSWWWCHLDTIPHETPVIPAKAGIQSEDPTFPEVCRAG